MATKKPGNSKKLQRSARNKNKKAAKLAAAKVMQGTITNTNTQIVLGENFYMTKQQRSHAKAGKDVVPVLAPLPFDGGADVTAKTPNSGMPFVEKKAFQALLDKANERAEKATQSRCGYTHPADNWMPPTLLPMVAKNVGGDINIIVHPTRGASNSARIANDAANTHKVSRKAYKTERRSVNSQNFTLAAVLKLIARRKGTAKAGGMGLTAFVFGSISLTTLVAEAVVRLTPVSPVKRRKEKIMSMTYNQRAARAVRKNRQARNARRRVVAKSATARKQQRVKSQAKVAARTTRRALAAIEQQERMLALGVVTKETRSLCAAFERPVTPAERSAKAKSRLGVTTPRPVTAKAKSAKAKERLGKQTQRPVTQDSPKTAIKNRWERQAMMAARQAAQRMADAMAEAQEKAAAIVAEAKEKYGAGDLVMMLTLNSSTVVDSWKNAKAMPFEDFVKDTAAVYGAENSAVVVEFATAVKKGSIGLTEAVREVDIELITGLLNAQPDLSDANIAEHLDWNGVSLADKELTVLLVRLVRGTNQNKTKEKEKDHKGDLVYNRYIDDLIKAGALECVNIYNKNYSRGGKIMIALTNGMKDGEKCNNNSPLGYHALKALGEKATPRLFLSPEPQVFEGLKQPTTVFCSQTYHKGLDVRAANELSFDPSRAKSVFYFVSSNPCYSGETLGWLDQVFANFDVKDSKTGIVARLSEHIDINYEMLNEGNLCRNIQQGVKVVVPEGAAELRQILRDLIFNGASSNEVEILADKGNYVEVYHPLNEVLDGNGIKFGDKFTKRHMFVVVASIVDVVRHSKTQYKNCKLVETEIQYRCYADRMTIFHVTEEVASKLYNCIPDELVANRTCHWPLWTRGEVKKVKNRKYMPLKGKDAAAAYAKSLIEQLTETKVVESVSVDEPTVNKVSIPVTKPAVEKGAIAEELEALYGYLNNVALTGYTRNEEFISAAEMLRNGLPSSKNAARLDLFVKALGWKPEDIEHHIFGDTKRFGAKAAWLCYAYLMGHCGSMENIFNYRWEVEDIADIVKLIQGSLSLHSAKLENNGVKTVVKIADLIDMKDNVLYLGNQIGFTFDAENRMVYDGRGRALTNTVRISADKEDVYVTVADSFSNFMYMVVTGILPLIANMFGHSLPTNLSANIIKLANTSNLYNFTTDDVKGQNGGAAHGLMAMFPAVIETNFNPFVKEKWVQLHAGGAAALLKLMKKAQQLIPDGVRDVDVIASAIPFALSEYKLDFHPFKSSFVGGYLGHVSIEAAKRYAPNLFEALKANLGVDDLCTSLVISNTLKASKGLKRVMLSLAQAASVVGGVDAGWQLFNQDKRVNGFKETVAYAPTMVGAPGIGYRIGHPDNLPTAEVFKIRTNYTKRDFVIPEGAAHPFNFAGSSILALMDTEWTVEEKEGATFIYPVDTIHLKGDGQEILCTVHLPESAERGTYENNRVRHELTMEGDLQWISYRVVNSIRYQRQELEINYCVRWTENHVKGRDISKKMQVVVDPSILFNELNGDKLTGRDIKQLDFQDCIKSDTSYSWLLVAANVISGNAGSTDPDYLELLAEAEAIAKTLGKEFDRANPILWIEPYCVAAGFYNKLMELFVNTFKVDGVWTVWRDSAPVAKHLYTFYTNLVEAGQWYRIDNPAELSKKEVEGCTWVSYCEDAKPKQESNILSFLLHNNGSVVLYAQQASMLMSTPNLPLYNVTAWESSTVKEAIGSSTQMLANIKSLDAIITDKEVARKLQRNMLRDGADALMRLKLLAGMQQEYDFASQPVSIRKGGGTVRRFGAKTLDSIWEALDDAGVTEKELASLDPEVFKKVCKALYNLVFVVDLANVCDDMENPYANEEKEKFSVWLPGLYSISKLSTDSETNLDFVGKFYNDILVPLLLNQNTVSNNELDKVYGIFDSFLSNDNAVKVMNGRRSTGAKRVGLPCIPFDETWVLYSKDTNSAFQQLKRDGVDVEGAMRGKTVLIYGTRAPMPVGFISVLRIVVENRIKQANGSIKVVQVPKAIKQREGVDLAPTTYHIGPSHFGVNQMAIYFDGGDFDGDPHYLTALCELFDIKYTTKEWQLFSLRKEALGIDMLDAGCGSYFADHYKIKSWSDATATLGSSLAESLGSKAVKSNNEYGGYLSNAYLTQNKTVGAVYGIYMLGELFLDFANSLLAMGLPMPEEFKPLLTKDGKAVVMGIAELYEILLGGYDKWAVTLQKYFIGAIKEGNQIPVTENSLANLVTIIKGLKGNSSLAPQILCLMNLSSLVFAQGKNKQEEKPKQQDKEAKPAEEVIDTTSVKLWASCALVIFEMNRARFDGYNGIIRPFAENKRGAGHRGALRNAAKLIGYISKDCPELVTECNAVFALGLVLKHLRKELGGNANLIDWTDAELNFFVNSLDLKYSDDVLVSYEVVEDTKDYTVEEDVFIDTTAEEDNQDEDSEEDNGGQPEPKPTEPSDDSGMAADVEPDDEFEEFGDLPCGDDSDSNYNPDPADYLEEAAEEKVEEQSEPQQVIPAPVEAVTVTAPVIKPAAAVTQEEFVSKVSEYSKKVPADKLASILAILEEYANETEPMIVEIAPQSTTEETEQAYKIISGGQTGADFGALQGAVDVGLETGGTAPQHFRTEAGYKPELGIKYGLVESPVSNYAHRTEVNVKDSDATVVFMRKESTGSKQTVHFAKKHNKPCLVVSTTEVDTAVDLLKQFVSNTNCKVINIAGNRESVSKSIQGFVREVIVKTFSPDDSGDDTSQTPDPQPEIELETKLAVEQVVETKEVEVAAADTVSTIDDYLTQRLEEAGLTPSQSAIEKAKSGLATLSDEQLEVVKAVLLGEDVFLTGKGGTGKSYTTTVIVDVFKALGLPVLVVGTTTTSVENILGDATFNSAFGIGKQGFENPAGRRTKSEYDNLVNRSTRNKRSNKNLVDLSKQANTKILFVIDEVSMLDSGELSAIKESVANRGLKAQWMSVGDLLQIEVIKGVLLNEAATFDDKGSTVTIPSPLDNAKRFNLVENRRLAGTDDKFIRWNDALDQIRMGHSQGVVLPQAVVERIHASFNQEAPSDAMHLMFNNVTVMNRNEQKTKELIDSGAKHKTFHAQVGVGQEGWYRRGESTVFDPIPEHLTVAIGMPVMIRQKINDSKNKMLAANGSTGIVVGWFYDKKDEDWVIQVKLNRTGETVPVRRVELNIKDTSKNKECTVLHYPLCPAYAITFMKSQGLTFDCPVVIHCYCLEDGVPKPLQTNNYLYVALSRMSNPDNLYFQTKFGRRSKTRDELVCWVKQSFKTNRKTAEWVMDFENQ